MKKLLLTLLLLIPVLTQAQQDTNKILKYFKNDFIIFSDTLYGNFPRLINYKQPLYSYIQFESDDKGNVFLKIIRGDNIITYRLILNENLTFERE